LTKIPNYTHGDVASEIDAVDILNSEVEEIIYFFDETDCQDEDINSIIFCLYASTVVVCGVVVVFSLFLSTASFVGDW